jgi:hypothetical protein
VSRFRTLLGVATAVALIVACAEVGTAPDVPAAIELPPFPFPSVVVGDTLRNEAGIATPVRAIVRNSAGEIITDATPTYLYADFRRDSAFRVDSTTGVIVAAKTVPEGRIAARIGSSLQVIRTLIATVKPDTTLAGTAPADLIVTLPDTGRARAQSNTTPDLPIRVRNRSGTTPVEVQGWLVRFEVIRPANPTNDTTAAAYLVDDQFRASTLDTTNASGQAARRVRVRAAQFPAAQGSARVTDSVVVRATLSYKGRPVPGSPVRLVGIVIRPASQ